MEQINPHCHTNVVNAKYLLYSHFFIPHGGASARDTIIGNWEQGWTKIHFCVEFFLKEQKAH